MSAPDECLNGTLRLSAGWGEVAPLHAFRQFGCVEELDHYRGELIDEDSTAGQEVALLGGVPLAVGVTEGLTVPAAVGVLRVAPAVMNRDDEPVIGFGAAGDGAGNAWAGGVDEVASLVWGCASCSTSRTTSGGLLRQM